MEVNSIQINSTLDWSLKTAEERSIFANDFCAKTSNLTHADLEALSNYILYPRGSPYPYYVKNPQKTNIASLDSLTEEYEDAVPIHKLGSSSTKLPIKYTFDRNKAQSSSLNYSDLWKEIDKTDLIIQCYELKTGKRKTLPLEKLWQNLSEADLNDCVNAALSLTSTKLGQLKKQLVEQRQQQFIMRDAEKTTIWPHSSSQPLDDEFTSLSEVEGIDAQILPVGAYTERGIRRLFWKRPLIPSSFTRPEAEAAIREYWRMRHQIEADPAKFTIDFEDEQTVAALIRKFQLITPGLSRNTPFLNDVYRTLKFYLTDENLADSLKASHRRILQLKFDLTHEYPLKEIARIVNEEYGTNYKEGYITIILRTNIAAEVTRIARIHRETIPLLLHPEEFKTCKGCGRTLPQTSDFFNRSLRGKNGYAPYCKRCTRDNRQISDYVQYTNIAKD